VSHGLPKVVHLAVYLYENLVQMPLQVRVRPHFLRLFSADFSGEHWAETVPPVPHRFVADVDASLVQQVFDIPQ
jgi:hypothetical protein